jgi:hypothetical protein
MVERMSAELVQELKAKEDAALRAAEEKAIRRRIRKQIRQKGKIDKLYFEEALKNYESADYKLCMIYLNKLTLDTPVKVRHSARLHHPFRGSLPPLCHTSTTSLKILWSFHRTIVITGALVGGCHLRHMEEPPLPGEGAAHEVRARRLQPPL